MAAFYIYRNLQRKDTFSIRFRGIVIDRLVNFEAHDVSFKVNELSRLQVLKKRQRNVHAFVVAQSYKPFTISNTGLRKVWYNPRKTATFMLEDIPIFRANRVLFIDGQCYLEEHEEYS